MNKNSFTYKILPILAIFMFVLFTLTTSCFASTDLDHNGTTYTFPTIDDLPNDFSQYKDNKYFYAYFLNKAFLFVDCGGDLTIDTSTSGGYKYLTYSNCYRFWFNGDTISYQKDPNSQLAYAFIDTSAPVGEQLVYSGSFVSTGNFDIVLDDGTVVFQAPVEEVAKQTILAPVITETTQEGTTLQEIMQTKTLQEIVEILPIVIPVMVGLIACLIGLKYLWKLLRKS